MKEWILLLAALLTLGGFVGWTLFNEYSTIAEREYEHLAAQATVVDKVLGRQLGAVHGALTAIRNELPRWRQLPDGMESAGHSLRAFVEAMPGVRTMLIIDAAGNTLASSRPGVVGQNFRSRDYFQAPLQDPDPDRFYIGPPFQTLFNVWAMNVVLMVPGPNGEFAGIVSATIDPEEFKIVLDSVNHTPDMWSALAHGDGELFLMMPERPELAGSDLAQPGSLFLRHLASGQVATVMTGKVLNTGEHRIMAQHTVWPDALKMDKPLVVAVGRDLQAVYAPWRADAMAYGVFFALLTTVSVGGLVLLRRRRRLADLERASAARILREKAQELERFFSVSQHLMCVADMAGHFIKLNTAWAKTLGYELADLEGKLFIDFVHPDDREATLVAIANLATGQDVAYFTNRYRTENGDYRHIEWNSTPYDGRLIYAAARDVTERIDRERRLKEISEAAEAANRAKSAFLANMSHEIRTPMNAVLGLLQLLLYTRLDANQIDYAGKAQQAAQSLLAILNDILDFSKIEAGKIELDRSLFRLDESLRSLAVILSASLRNHHLEVLFQVDPAVPRVLRGDGLRLQQVLMNLAGNAVKFTEQGEVVISVQLRGCTPDSARIEFSVRDTGIGIAADRLTAVFEGFAQAEISTTRRYGGTGLGLAISQRLVGLMGGELEVETTPGRGSDFHFILTFGLDAETSADSWALDPNAVDSGALRVMIVDDNAMAREILTGMATSFGWQVEAAIGGDEAIERLLAAQVAGNPFDILCIDWIMPGMDGWETIRRIRAGSEYGSIPAILMITAHGHELIATGLGPDIAQIDGLLTKPVTPSMLFDAVVKVTHGASAFEDRTAATRPVGPNTLAGLRILVVDDNVLNQQVVQQLLAHAGAWAQVAADGRRGIAAFRTAEQPFDAILMDIQMPEMDGYEATRILRAEMQATLPIIAMTANVLPADREACLAAGMNDHIGKPIDIVGVVATLLRHCRPDTMEESVPATPPAATDLPPLPEGFDLAAALHRMDNDRAMFSNLVRGFLAEEGAIRQRIEDALQQGDRLAAGREFHNLKGSAAMLGAVALSRLAGEAENAVRTKSVPVANDPRLTAIGEHLTNVAGLLRGVADIFDAVPTASAAESTGDPARLRALFAELDQLLAKQNMRSFDVFATIRQEAGGTLQDGLATLDDALAKLDFPAARNQVAQFTGLL